MPDGTPFSARLWSLLSGPRALEDLRRYFTVTDGRPVYTGARFEQLDGGGDRPEIAHTVTASDLIAVQTLSVTIPAGAALALLEGGLGTTLGKLLQQIPLDLDMADADPGMLQPGSPADQAWVLLEQQMGLGWVTTGKLLARKRPQLLPVYDRVVRCTVQRPESYWLSLQDALSKDGGSLHTHLLKLRDEAAVPATVSALRVLDVALWMRHHAEHTPKGFCPGVPL